MDCFCLRQLLLLCALCALWPATGHAQWWNAYGRARVGGHFETEGAGYNTFGSLEAFVPLWESEEAIWFSDSRLNLSDHSQFGSNLGFGYRWYDECRDRIWGFNAFYDYRDAGRNEFQQGGVGVEGLGKLWDLRSNLYLPADHGLESVRFRSPFFTGPYIGLLHDLEAAMIGGDVEAGRIICRDTFGELRAFAGVYHYQASDFPKANGVRVRLEGAVLDRSTWCSLSVQNDRVFDTNVVFGLTFYWPQLARRAWFRPGKVKVCERLADPVYRNRNITLANRTQVAYALDPNNNGLPPRRLRVAHVDSSAAGGVAANGDFDPAQRFQTLTEAQAAQRDIIFVHNGTYLNPIELAAGQQLLGDGTPHPFRARQGVFFTPIVDPATTTSPPLLLSSGLAAGMPTVRLASNTTVAGLNFQLSNVDHAILGKNLTGTITIGHNTIEGANQPAVMLTHQIGGRSVYYRIHDNTLNRNPNGALSVKTSGGTVCVDLVNNIDISGIAMPYVLEEQIIGGMTGEIEYFATGNLPESGVNNLNGLATRRAAPLNGCP